MNPDLQKRLSKYVGGSPATDSSGETGTAPETPTPDGPPASTGSSDQTVGSKYLKDTMTAMEISMPGPLFSPPPPPIVSSPMKSVEDCLAGLKERIERARDLAAANPPRKAYGVICDKCSDDGYVFKYSTYESHGYTYSRAAITACQNCAAGAAWLDRRRRNEIERMEKSGELKKAPSRQMREPGEEG